MKQIKTPLETDERLLLLDPDDNIYSVAQPIKAGEIIQIEGETVTLDKNAGLGFKVARVTIPSQRPVVKYGAIIGLTNQEIAQGSLVHIHNIESLYLANTEKIGTIGDERL